MSLNDSDLGFSHISGVRAPADGICLIKEDLRKLEDEDEVPGFHEERARLLRMLNNAQDLTRNLPQEIMSKVFEWYKVLTEKELKPKLRKHRNLTERILILGHITHRWRQIAWSTPQLWTKIRFRITSPRTINAISDLLQLSLHNVKGLKISLRIWFLYDQEDTLEEALLDSLLKLLTDREYATKIRSIYLHRPPQRLIPSLLSSDNFQQLEEVRVSDYATREFALNNSTLAGLPWPNLTKLTFVQVPIDICMKVLAHSSTRLTHVHIYQPRDPVLTDMTELTLPEPDTIIAFPGLDTLCWPYHPHPLWLALSQRIRAPSLRRLKWEGDSEFIDPPEHIFQPILEGRFRSLTHLFLHHLKLCSTTFFQRAFSHIEQLVDLSLYDCDEVSMKSFLSIFHPGNPQETEQEVKYLPKLHTFFASPCDDGLSLGSVWTQSMFRLLERQWRNGVQDFFLSVDKIIFDWDPEVQLAVKKLIDEGFGLNITDDTGTTLPWVELMLLSVRRLPHDLATMAQTITSDDCYEGDDYDDENEDNDNEDNEDNRGE